MEIGGVWLDGETGGDYSEDMLLEPMLHILQGVSWQEQVRLWDRETDDERYEILYRGRRCFDTLDGLQYVPGGSDTETGDPVLEKLSDGGQVVGYEVSLHMPAQEAVTPVRYCAVYYGSGVYQSGRSRRKPVEADGRNGRAGRRSDLF